MTRRRRERSGGSHDGTHAPQRQDAPRPARRLTMPLVAALVALAALVLVAHFPALTARALSFDDRQYLTQNPLVRAPSLASAERFLTEVTHPSSVRGYYQPLAMISLMLDVAAGGSESNLAPFHRTSLALHAANALLLMLLAWRLFGSVPAAFAAAALFGLHPMTVEALPWVGERKTLLAAFFALLAFHAWLGAVRANAARPSTRRAWLAATAGLFVLALLAKPTAIPFPLILLLFDVWPLRRLSLPPRWADALALLVEKAPLFAAAAISAWITFVSQANTAVATLPSERGPGSLVLTVAYAVALYVRKIVWPVDLTSHYPTPNPLSLANPAVLGSVALLAALGVALIVFRRRLLPLSVALAAFVVGLGPTLGVVGFTNVVASDKYCYLPAVGLVLALAAGLTRAFEGPARSVVAAACGVVAIAEIGATRAYLRDWQTSDALYARMLAHAPEDPVMVNAYASLLVDEGRIDEAVPRFQDALRLNPDLIEAHVNLGHAFYRQRRYEEAAPEFRQALKLDPSSARAHGDLGVTLKQLGQLPEAVAEYREALRLDPSYVTPRSNLANVLRAQGKLDEAVSEYREALRLDPFDASAHNNLGTALFDLGRYDDAAAEFVRAENLGKAYADPFVNLVLTRGRQGRLDDAVSAGRDALRRLPSDPALASRIGSALLSFGRRQEAADAFRQALALDPASAEATTGLAAASGP